MRHLKIFENFGKPSWNNKLYEYIRDSFIDIEDMGGETHVTKCVYFDKQHKTTNKELINIFGEDTFTSDEYNKGKDFGSVSTSVTYIEDESIERTIDKATKSGMSGDHVLDMGIRMQTNCINHFNKGYIPAYYVYIRIPFETIDEANMWVNNTNRFKGLSDRFGCDLIIQSFKVEYGFLDIKDYMLSIVIIFKEIK